MVRLKKFEEKGENPWRIASQKVIFLWQNGNDNVLKQEEAK
jgi:hypothetical protein